MIELLKGYFANCTMSNDDESCVSAPDYRHPDGETCAGMASFCSGYGTDHGTQADGRSANEACCECGGGSAGLGAESTDSQGSASGWQNAFEHSISIVGFVGEGACKTAAGLDPPHFQIKPFTFEPSNPPYNVGVDACRDICGSDVECFAFTYGLTDVCDTLTNRQCRQSAACRYSNATKTCDAKVQASATTALPASTEEDEDGDGFPRDVDCNDVDPAVFPGAPEQPTNGVDDNCNGVIDEGEGEGEVAECSHLDPSACTQADIDAEDALGTSISDGYWTCKNLTGWETAFCTDPTAQHYDWARNCPAHCAEVVVLRTSMCTLSTNTASSSSLSLPDGMTTTSTALIVTAEYNVSTKSSWAVILVSVK